jgi:hypothetical protein
MKNEYNTPFSWGRMICHAIIVTQSNRNNIDKSLYLAISVLCTFLNQSVEYLAQVTAKCSRAIGLPPVQVFWSQRTCS